ncbi:MAG: ATP-grasp domain-containing protein [Bacteroidales bacterium]
MKQKKLLLLGGLKYLIPVIESAHKLGYYVITCDYIPDNIAHKYSDEYHNVSIIDKQAVLELAKKLKVDGIMSFAVDPGVVTAAYVSEKLGLPTPPYESVRILQNKKLFREFLSENNFNVPKAEGYTDINEAISEVDKFQWPIIVKPTDSAGSKGVTKVEKKDQLKSAIKYAIINSLSGEFIIEEFIQQQGYSSDSDCFSINNDLQFVTFSNQRFDSNVANPYTPAAYTWPSSISESNQIELKSELQRLIKILHLGTSIYNIEVREGLDGKSYIMEVSPRGGGNRLSEIVYLSTGFNIIEYAIQAAMGEKLKSIKQLPYNGHWAEIILHSDRDATFSSLYISDKMKGNVYETDLWVKKGDKINNFRGANDAIGTLILKFKDKESLESALCNQDKWLLIKSKNKIK